jgi:hypothetical protein
VRGDHCRGSVTLCLRRTRHPTVGIPWTAEDAPSMAHDTACRH